MMFNFRYYTTYLACLNDTFDLYCDRARDVAKQFFTYTYTVSARDLLSEDCPLLNIIPGIQLILYSLNP